MPRRCVEKMGGISRPGPCVPFIQSVPESNDARFLFRFFALLETFKLQVKKKSSRKLLLLLLLLVVPLNAVLLVVVGVKAVVQERVLLGQHGVFLRTTLSDLRAEVSSNNGDQSAEPPGQSRVSSLETPGVKQSR